MQAHLMHFIKNHCTHIQNSFYGL